MSDVTCRYCQLKIHKSSLAKHVRTVHKIELAKQAPRIDMLLGVKRKEPEPDVTTPDAPNDAQKASTETPSSSGIMSSMLGSLSNVITKLEFFD